MSKSFGSVSAVRDVSCATKEGEIFGLLGPNGAGKSTTIKMIMNILAPDGGEILFNGKHIAEEDKDRIGYLPEERGLYRKVKINEMLLYLARLKNAAMDADAGLAFQGHGPEGPVHRLHPPRPRVHLS